MRRLWVLVVVAQIVGASTFLPQAPVAVPPMPAQYVTTDWAALLGSYVAFCKQSAQPQYYVDCLSERFAFTASRMDPYSPDTADLRKALQTAANDLSAITTRYHTLAAGEARPRAPGITPTRALRAIAPQNRAVAGAAGTQVLDTAELVLLRSADRDPTRALAFTQVAEVIGTAKVLLRSA